MLLARLLRKGHVPRSLRKTTRLTAGDEALILSSRHGKPVQGPFEAPTREMMRGGTEVLIYNRDRTFDFDFEHLPPGEMEPLRGILSLAVRVLEEQPTLIRDRFLSKSPDKSGVSIADAHMAIDRRLAGHWGEVLVGCTIQNRRERGVEAGSAALEVARGALSPLGLYASEAMIKWGDSEEEGLMRDVGEYMGKSASRGIAAQQIGEARIRETVRKAREGMREERDRGDLEKAKGRMERENEIMLIAIENQKIIARAHGIEL